MDDTIAPPSPRPPTPPVERADAPGASGALAFQVGVAAVVGLYFAGEVLIPITLAVLLSFLLTPLVNGLRRVLPRAPAVLLAVALASGAVLALGGLIGTQLAGLAPDMPRYAAAVQRKVEAVEGFGARAVPNAAASREAIGRLDPTGVAMVCVAHLDVGANPSRLRHAVQRLRARLPDRPVLVGLWPAGDTAPEGGRVRAEIGADRCAGSLRAAVQACLDEAHRAHRGAAAVAAPAAWPGGRPPSPVA